MPVSGDHDRLSDAECESRARKIKALRECSSYLAVENLLRIVQFDNRGELSIHASLAMATKRDRNMVRNEVAKAFKKAPPTCEAGYPPKFGQNVFPKSRLLYVLAWIGDNHLMRKLLDESKSWPGTNKCKLLAYELCKDVGNSLQAVTDKLVYLEYLDEAGTPELMNLTLDLYPEIGLSTDVWKDVRRH